MNNNTWHITPCLYLPNISEAKTQKQCKSKKLSTPYDSVACRTTVRSSNLKFSV